MTLIDLIRSLEPAQLDSLAERSGTSVGNLKQIAYGYRLAGPGLAINLDRESGRAVTVGLFRPRLPSGDSMLAFAAEIANNVPSTANWKA
ncbi:hypothetical protein [Pseudomonas sp. PB3P13]